LDNATYCDDALDKRIAELEAELKELNESMPHPPLSDMLRAFVDSNMLACARSSINGRFYDVNLAYADMLGYTREELLKVSWRDLTPPEYKEGNDTALAELVATGKATYEKEYWRKDGSRVTVLLTMTCTDPDNILAIAVNLTELQNAELQAKKNEEQFRLLVESIPQIVYVSDANANITYLNRRFTDYTGLSAENALQRAWADTIHPDDLPRILELREHCIESLADFEMELRHLHRDGTYHWSLCKSIPLIGPDGQIYEWIGTATDIDERKHTEEELRDREERFRVLADGIPQIVWTASADGVIDFFNHRWLEYTGLTIEQSLGGAWQLLVHPHDLEAYVSSWKHAAHSGETYEHEFRLKRAVGLQQQSDSPYLWHLSRAVALRNSSGRIIKWFGTWTDIHEQKKS
jgi:PAS domain S-box-containing protein